jgi:glycosyltransferase involved in cell wall biosynthesis
MQCTQMKVALVTTDFLPNIGGITQHVVEVAKALVADGDDVEVLAPIYGTKWADITKPCYRELSDGIPVWRIPLVLNTSVRFVSGQISSRISERRLQRQLLGRLREIQPDVVHWHALESRGHPLATWTKSAKVWTNHTSHFIVGIKSSRRRHYQEEAGQADEIICPSEELCELTASLGVSRDRIHFIPNGVDSNRFRPDAETSYWRRRLRLTDSQRLILCPRRLERKNGVSYFVRAAISLLQGGVRDITFAVAGDFSGPKSESEEDLVKQLIADSRFSVHFQLLGRVQNSEMPGLYACSNIVVMPSLMEATSLSAMEGMAAGKPIVSTNVGGLPFLIRDGENGFLVPPRQPDRIADAMKRLIDSPSLRVEMGKNGRARVETELNWQNVVRRTKEVYARAIATHSDLIKPLANVAAH